MSRIGHICRRGFDGIELSGHLAHNSAGHLVHCRQVVGINLTISSPWRGLPSGATMMPEVSMPLYFPAYFFRRAPHPDPYVNLELRDSLTGATLHLFLGIYRGDTCFWQKDFSAGPNGEYSFVSGPGDSPAQLSIQFVFA